MKIDIKGTIIRNDDKWIYDFFDMTSTCPRDVLAALGQAKGEEISPLAEHMPIKTKGVFLYGICIRCRIFPLCAVFTKTHSFRQTYWGKKPAGKLCARIDLNSFAGDAQAWC